MCASKTTFKPGLTRIAAMALLGATGMVYALTAHAADEQREQEQVRRLKAQIRQVQQQQEAAVQEANAKADAAKAEMGKNLKSAQSDAASQRAAAGAASRKAKALGEEVETLKKDKARLDAELAETKKALDELKAKSAEQQGQSTQAIAGWQGHYKQLSDANEQCRTHNAELYTLGTDLLSRYENKGLGEVMASKEPFLMTARVKLENTKAEYQDKLDAARLKARP